MSAMASGGGTRIGWLPSTPCPRGGFHLSPVYMSMSPPASVTATVGWPTDTPVEFCDCDGDTK